MAKNNMKGIKRDLKAAHIAVEKLIYDSTDRSSFYSRGLASEGYNAGYLAALSDVTLALNGVKPDRWIQWERRKEKTND